VNQPPPTFALPAIPYLASSTDPAVWSGQRPDAALFGAPLDLTESFRSGTHAGPSAVRRVSDVLETYSPDLDRDLEDVVLLDLGDLLLADLDMEPALAAIAAASEYVARSARLAMMLGGEHTASLGAFRGVHRVYADLALLHIDAHLDIRPEYRGHALSHASWVHQLGQEQGFDCIFQLGLRSGDRAEWRFAHAHTRLCARELELPSAARRELAGRPVYVSIDIDVLDPAYAPGTGCPEPGGATFDQLLDFVHKLRDLTIVAVDVMEVSPNFDPADITATAAAKLVREFVLLSAL
jgi:agmatinase